MSALAVLVLASRFVLVAADGPLHTTPDGTGPAVRVAAPGTAPGQTQLFRLLKERGAWVDVETLGVASDAHCEAGIPSLEDARIRFTVPRASLVPVTTKETTVRFADGSSLRLPPGVALEDAGGRYRVIGVAWPSFPLDAQAVGTSYRAPRALRGKTAPDLRLAIGATITIDGKALAPDALGFQASTVEDELVIDAAKRVEARSLVTVRRACLEASGWTRPDDVVAPGAGQLSGLYGFLHGDATFYVRRGAKLWWADGRPAGVTTGKLELDAEVPTADARVCHQVPLDRRSGTRLGFGLAATTPELARSDAHVVLCFSHRDRRAVSR